MQSADALCGADLRICLLNRSATLEFYDEQLKVRNVADRFLLFARNYGSLSRAAFDISSARYFISLRIFPNLSCFSLSLSSCTFLPAVYTFRSQTSAAETRRA